MKSTTNHSGILSFIKVVFFFSAVFFISKSSAQICNFYGSATVNGSAGANGTFTTGVRTFSNLPLTSCGTSGATAGAVISMDNIAITTNTFTGGAPIFTIAETGPLTTTFPKVPTAPIDSTFRNLTFAQLISTLSKYTIQNTGIQNIEIYWINPTAGNAVNISYSYSFQYNCTPSSGPAITPTAVSNTCPTSTVNLLTQITNTGTKPSGTRLVWSLNNPPTNSGDTLTSAQASAISTPGTYYAFYFKTSTGCYSTSPDSVAVSFTTCALAIDFLKAESEKINNKAINIKFSLASIPNAPTSFIIERSNGNSGFTEIGILKNTNSTDYNFIDNNPNLTGNNVYRIKQLDIYGSIVYSKLLIEKFGNAVNEFLVAPNPAKNILTVSMPVGFLNKNIGIAIFNLNGQKLYENRLIDLSNTTQAIDVSMISPGTYFMQCKSELGITTKKIMIVR